MAVFDEILSVHTKISSVQCVQHQVHLSVHVR